MSGLAQVRREEERVEQRSAVFRKELGLTDLVLTQIVFVVGTIWVGTAAKLGNQQLLFWLLAIVTFYLPLAAVVIANARLPMVAGWDDLLPAWFTRLHARYKTPVNSIMLVGALALALGLLSLAGVGMQEANQLLENAGGIFYATSYVVLFVIPLFAAHRIGLRAPLWLRIASASGLLVSLLYIALTIFPIVEVESRLSFAVKLIAVTLLFNLAGAALYRAGRRKQRSA